MTKKLLMMLAAYRYMFTMNVTTIVWNKIQ